MAYRLRYSDYGMAFSMSYDFPFAVFFRENREQRQAEECYWLAYDNNSFGMHFGMAYYNSFSFLAESGKDAGMDYFGFLERKEFRYGDTVYIEPEYMSYWLGPTFHNRYIGCRAGLLINYRYTMDFLNNPEEEEFHEMVYAPYILLEGAIGGLIKPLLSYIGGQNIIEPASLIMQFDFSLYHHLIIIPGWAYISDPYGESNLSFSQYRLDVEYYLKGFENDGFLETAIYQGLCWSVGLENTYMNDEYGIWSSWTEPENLVLRTTLSTMTWGVFFVSDLSFEHPGGGIYKHFGKMFETRFGINDVSRYRAINRRHAFSIYCAMNM
jgi:hypothetical protein